MKSVLNLLLLIVASASLCAQCKVDTMRGAIVMLNKIDKLHLCCELLNGGKLQSLAIDWRNYNSEEIKMKGDFTNPKKSWKKNYSRKTFAIFMHAQFILYFF
jgi:hypothetical protein